MNEVMKERAVKFFKDHNRQLSLNQSEMCKFIDEWEGICNKLNSDRMGGNEKMIAHYSPCELIDIAIGVTAQMKEDIVVCKDHYPNCQGCGWQKVEVVPGLKACSVEKIVETVFKMG